MIDWIHHLLLDWADAMDRAEARDPLGYPHRTAEARAGEGRGGGKPGARIPLFFVSPAVNRVDSAIRAMPVRYRQAIEIKYRGPDGHRAQLHHWQAETGRGKSCYKAMLREGKAWLAGRLGK